MLIKIYPENPQEKEIERVVSSLKLGGVIIYPTDTVYGMGCDIFNKRAIERIAKIKSIKLEKANFAFICESLSHLSDFTRPLDNSTFKLVKSHMPGPFTFILPANSKVPKLFTSKKNTVGIRVPDNKIITEIVRRLGNPILTTSVVGEEGIIESTTDPELIYDRYEKSVDIVIDGGYGGIELSTVVDCTGDEPVIVRQGKGIL